MWGKLGAFILRYRLPLLVLMLGFTTYMGFEALHIRKNYKFIGVLPKDDSTYIEYQRFIHQFSEDGNVLAIGYNDERIWQLANYQKWIQLGDDLRNIKVDVHGEEKPATDSVFSSARCYTLFRNDSLQKFEFRKLVKEKPQTQAAVDSIRQKLFSLPFYEGILFQKESAAGLMMVFINAALFDSKDRGNSVDQALALTDKFTAETGINTYLSGLPFIRDQMMKRVEKELNFFSILSALLCVALLWIFFRSWKVLVVVMSVVIVGVIISLGTMAIFDYPLTMLMALMPPLMIVTSVPKCIYLVTKYHQEYKRSANRTGALVRVVQRMGAAS